MKNLSLKWITGITAILLLAFTVSCKNSEQDADTENSGDMDEMENMEMDQMNDDMENNSMGDMEMDEEIIAPTVSLQGEPEYMVDYIAIKDALVRDNFELVKKLATSMQESLGYAELQSPTELQESLQRLQNANDIQSQRKEFAQLSRTLYQVVKNENVSDKTLYRQNCPMAFNGEGANWLSYEEQVRNPYMGQRMPGCGSVAEKI